VSTIHDVKNRMLRTRSLRRLLTHHYTATRPLSAGWLAHRSLNSQHAYDAEARPARSGRGLIGVRWPAIRLAESSRRRERVGASRVDRPGT
jgi:hypothetical protein